VAFKGIGITISRKYPQRDFVAEPRALKKNPKGIPSHSPGLLVREKPWVKRG